MPEKYAEYPGELPEDIRYAIKIKIAHALGGGYDESARRLTLEVRRQVRERDHGRCVLCGAPGEEIDHIDGPSAALPNLRLLCGPCHRQVTATRLVPITDEDTLRRRDQLVARIYGPLALPCDTPDWHERWREWVNEHRRPVQREAGDIARALAVPPGKGKT